MFHQLSKCFVAAAAYLRACAMMVMFINDLHYDQHYVHHYDHHKQQQQLSLSASWWRQLLVACEHLCCTKTHFLDLEDLLKQFSCICPGSVTTWQLVKSFGMQPNDSLYSNGLKSVQCLKSVRSTCFCCYCTKLANHPNCVQTAYFKSHFKAWPHPYVLSRISFQENGKTKMFHIYSVVLDIKYLRSIKYY